MLSIIITNYNTWHLVDKCIQKVFTTTNERFIGEIIVVDDHSETVDDYEITKNNKVILHKNLINLGYATSVNIGFSLAKNPFCLLLDSDAFPIEDLSSIISFFEDHQTCGIQYFNLIDNNGNPTGNKELEPDFWSILLGQQVYGLFYESLKGNKSNICAYSCGIAVRKSCFDSLNGFDTQFDFLDADIDFSMRVNKSNWDILFNNKCKILHEGNGSPQTTSKRVIRYYENRFMLLKKHKKLPLKLLIKVLVLFRITFELVIIFLLRLKYNFITWKDKIISRISLYSIVIKA